MKLLFTILLIIFLVVNEIYTAEIKAQKTIIGNLTNDETGQPVPGVNIHIENTALGAVSNRIGNFIISALSNGLYHLNISAIGYETKILHVNLNDSTIDTTYLSIRLHENVYKTSEIVISANKQIEAVQDVPISVSIIDSRQINQRNNTLIDDALKYVPGVVVNQQNISIRGSSGFAFGLGSRVAMLIDGFPVLSGDNGDIKYDIFPVNQIERIEIVKGAGSALYGTAAIGGVVNIITKEPTPKPQIGVRAFSGFYTLPPYNQWQYRTTLPFKSGLDLNYSQSFNDLGVMFSSQLIRDEGFHQYNDYTKWNLFGKIKYAFSEFTTLSFLGNYANDNTTDWVYWNSLDSATIPPTTTDKSIRIKSDKLFAATELKHIFSNPLFSTLKFSYLKTTFNNTFPVSSTDYRQSNAESFYTELLFNHNWNEKLNFTYGLNYNLNSVESATYGNHVQMIYAGYVQSELTYIDKLIITAGMRFDMEQTRETEKNLLLSPKIGFNLALSDDTRMRLSAGRGFRAPNIAEKYASVTFQGFNVVPNTGLKPENSWSAELGINQKIILDAFDFQLDAVTFINSMNNLIEPTFDISLPDAPIKFLNITRARITGVEFDFKAVFRQWIHFQTALTLMDPVDLTLHETLKYRNNIIWYSGIGFDFKFMELQADYRFLSKIKNIDQNLGLQIRDYDARVPVHIIDTRLILKLETMFDIPLHLSLNAKNLLNYIYTEIPGNLGATRYLSFQVEGSF